MTSSQLLTRSLALRLSQLEDVPPGLDYAALFVLSSLRLLVCGWGLVQDCVESDRWLDISVIICFGWGGHIPHQLCLQTPIKQIHVKHRRRKEICLSYLVSHRERHQPSLVQRVEAGPGAGGVGNCHRPRPGSAGVSVHPQLHLLPGGVAGVLEDGFEEGRRAGGGGGGGAAGEGDGVALAGRTRRLLGLGLLLLVTAAVTTSTAEDHIRS